MTAKTIRGHITWPDGMASPAATKRLAGGCLYTDGTGRVLLVQPTYKRFWDLPGGVVEAGESPRKAAAREHREELGFDVAPGRLLAVDYVSKADLMAFVFDGGVIDTSRIVLDTGELRQWAWCDAYERLMRMWHAPILARRVAAALDVKTRSGDTVFLEDGYFPIG